MDVLPVELYYEILKYLSIKELFTAACVLSVSWNFQVFGKHFLEYLVQREYKLSFKPVLSKAESCKLIRKNYPLRLKKLKFFAYSTNGGVFNNSPEYSHFNLFSAQKMPYCTRENSSNVDVSGIFLKSICDPEILFTSNDKIQECYDNNIKLSKKNFTTKNYLEIQGLYQAVKQYSITNYGIIKEIKAWKNRNWHPCTNLDEITSKVNRDILSYPCNLRISETSTMYAAIKAFYISNKGNFTCPVSVLMLFTSETYVEMDFHQFKLYNYLRNLNSVLQLLKTCPDSPRITNYKLSKRSEHIEFLQQSTNGLKPIAWVKLSADDSQIKLKQTFIGKYLYVKLICSKDRRNEYQGPETMALNIDCKCIVPIGYSINLSQY